MSDPSYRASDRISCSKLLIEYALLGIDQSKLDISAHGDLTIEVKGIYKANTDE